MGLVVGYQWCDLNDAKVFVTEKMILLVFGHFKQMLAILFCF